MFTVLSCLFHKRFSVFLGFIISFILSLEIVSWSLKFFKYLLSLICLRLFVFSFWSPLVVVFIHILYFRCLGPSRVLLRFTSGVHGLFSPETPSSAPDRPLDETFVNPIDSEKGRFQLTRRVVRLSLPP